MSKQNFDKFINKPIKGAKKKEKFKQEKKAAKKEREAYFIEKKRQVRAEKKLQQEGGTAPHQKKSYASKADKPAYNPKPADSSSYKKTDSSKEYQPKAAYPKKEKDRFQKDSRKPGTRKPGQGKSTESNDRQDSFQPKKREESTPASKIIKPGKTGDAERAGVNLQSKKTETADTRPAGIKPKRQNSSSSAPRKKTFQKDLDNKPAKNDPGLPYQRKPLKKAGDEKTTAPTSKPAIKVKKVESENGLMPLNKFIAHGGICSRRDAGELVKSGKVKVNGEVNTNPAYKVQEDDTVFANGKKVTPHVNLVYILLNKPKDYITTADDPQGRKTVLDIVKTATTERIYPVGRLDRNTSGVLLLTNDGELAQHLTHPSFEVRKIYEAKLDKPLAKADFEKLLSGINLEDGEVRADSVAYADSKDKSVIGVEIHSGKNRVVRRMFEHLGYDVKGLDRVMFANLTKKNVDRGKWRYLSEKEVRLLKFFNKSKR